MTDCSKKRRAWKLFRGYERIHIVVTDGRFARFPDYYNTRFKGLDVITTACKRHFREPHPVKTYYQPFDLSWASNKKSDELMIAHSPFGLAKFREKGTRIIEDAVRDMDVKFDLITGLEWKKAIRRKAKAHIFVDQVDHYAKDKFQFKSPDYVWDALGKSGIEAMHLGCLVITHGVGNETEIPTPPVAWVTKETFKETLDYYVNNPKEREELAQRGQEWAQKYSNRDYVAKLILQ